MKTKTIPTSRSAAEHMKDYATTIKTKSDELRSKETIQSDTKAELLAYVKDIKSTPEHKVLAAKYHEDMKKARSVFTTIMEDSDMTTNSKIRELFVTIKQHLYRIDEKKWDSHIKSLQKFFSMLSSGDKEILFNRIWRKTEDSDMAHKIFQEIQKNEPKMSSRIKAKEIRSMMINEWPIMPVFWIFCAVEDFVVFFNRKKTDLICLLFLILSATWVASVYSMFKEKKKILDDDLREGRENAILWRRWWYNSRWDGCDHSSI